jgi:hypothetical protein
MWLFMKCIVICLWDMGRLHPSTNLNWDTLYAMMRISQANFSVENICWNAVMLVWRYMKDRLTHPVLWRVSMFFLFEVLNMFIYINSYSIAKFTFNFNLWHYVKKVLNFVVDELMYACESGTSRLIFWLGISGLIALCLYLHVRYDIIYWKKLWKCYFCHPSKVNLTRPKTGSFSKNPSNGNVFVFEHVARDVRVLVQNHHCPPPTVLYIVDDTCALWHVIVRRSHPLLC